MWTLSNTPENTLVSILSWEGIVLLIFIFWLTSFIPSCRVGNLGFFHRLAEPPSSLLYSNLFLYTHSLVLRVLNLFATRWILEDGFDIPLTHLDWSPNLRDSSLLPFLQTGTVGDLIDHNSRSWKVDLIRSLYHHPKAVNILQMPISKINDSKDRPMWKYLRDGIYSTKRAYELLTEDFLESQQFQQERKIWTAIWKAMYP